jgi:hypothetical protein
MSVADEPLNRLWIAVVCEGEDKRSELQPTGRPAIDSGIPSEVASMSGPEPITRGRFQAPSDAEVELMSQQASAIVECALGTDQRCCRREVLKESGALRQG